MYPNGSLKSTFRSKLNSICYIFHFFEEKKRFDSGTIKRMALLEFVDGVLKYAYNVQSLAYSISYHFLNVEV